MDESLYRRKVLKKLDKMIMLLALSQLEGKSQGDKILFLDALGMDNQVIASLVGVSEVTVRSVKSRKGRTKKVKKNVKKV